ncbi:PLP-dependent cysteine synthase family protein [Candidatus Parcubacteria bacterium]|nr:PLP-dependent cysteine synthase family protein [Candidatus Parcubacteria bacterium]
MNNNILDTIGKTPLVKVGSNIFAKLEGFNPTGSIKDRIVLAMLEKAEKQGILTKDKTIIEPTSGNTGISLAMLGAIKGYKVKIVMPKSMNIMKRKMIEFFNGEIILIKDEDWRDNAIKFTKKLVKENEQGLVMLNQYENEENVKVHYETTAQEILDQMGEKCSRPLIDYFIAGIGTGGTITGIGKRLKEKYPKIKIIGIMPKKGSDIEGLKSLKEGYTPPILDLKIIDKIYEVDGKDALVWQKKLAKEYGIFVGVSSGAAMFIAQKIGKEIPQGNIITIFPDRGEKYL